MNPWWLYPLIGGALIGLSATLLLALNGRVAGISGMLKGIFMTPTEAGNGQRWAFLLGMIAAGSPLALMMGINTESPASVPVLLIAGVLVGLGTSLSNGCTSGHGVCGLGRRSARSLVAVVTFMSTAILTVLILRTVTGG